MTTASLPRSPALARALARALADEGPEGFLAAAESLFASEPEAWLSPLERPLLAEPAIAKAFPAVDFSLALDFDANEEEDPEPSPCLALAVCFSPAIWRLGAEFGSLEGARARELFSGLCKAQLAAEPQRSALARQGLGGALWSSTPRARFEPSPAAMDALDMDPRSAELSISFWRQRRLLALLDPHAKDIAPAFEEDDPLCAFELALLAPGCPPREEEALWVLSALGGPADWEAALGPLWASQVAPLAAETLNAAALELCSPSLAPNDLLARQLWPALAEACELSSDFIERACSDEADRPPARVAQLRSEAQAEIAEACRRCALAALPAGAPSEREIDQFPAGLREMVRLAALGAPAEPSAGGQVISVDFSKKIKKSP